MSEERIECDFCGAPLDEHAVKEGEHIFCSVKCADAHQFERETNAMVDRLAPNIMGLIFKIMNELGLVTEVPTVRIKCRQMDCTHNFWHWCRKPDGAVSIDEDGKCRSYQEF